MFLSNPLTSEVLILFGRQLVTYANLLNAVHHCFVGNPYDFSFEENRGRSEKAQHKYLIISHL